MITTGWRLEKRMVKKIGVLQLWFNPDTEKWAVSLDNRTYHDFYEIRPERVERWKREFGLKQSPLL